MGRAPRIEFEGAVYHVMCRGNRQEPVFRDSRDHELFLDTLGEACVRCGWRVHAFVLMGNHYHVLLETPCANLVDGMRWLQGTYTKRFNIRHRLWGHLFQGRYKALLVDPAENYFQTVCSYIHLNPARARCVEVIGGKLSEYVWSSFPQYLDPSKRFDWLVVERTLGNYSLQDDEAGRRSYELIMQKRAYEVQSSTDPQEADAQWAGIRKGWCFGSADFRDRMVKALDPVVRGKRRDSFTGDETRRHDTLDAQRLLEDSMKRLGLSSADLGVLKKSDPRKKVIAWRIRKRTSVKNEWIAQSVRMGCVSNMSNFVNQVEQAEEGILFSLKETLK